MNDAATSRSPFAATPEPGVRLRTRFLVYFSVWLLAVLAIQIFLPPEGPSETDRTAIHQRLLWPFYTPLMVVVGLARAATWPSRFPDWLPWAIVTGLAVHFIVAATRSRRSSFVAVTCFQVLVLAVGVIYFVRQSFLPTGG